MNSRTRLQSALLSATLAGCLFGLASCGGGGGDAVVAESASAPITASPPAVPESPPATGGDTQPAKTFKIGGTVTGLVGTGLVLQSGTGEDLPITANGSFAFSGEIPDGGSYAVTVKSQPSIMTRRCSVTDGGSVTGGSVTVSVECSVPAARFAYVASSLTPRVTAYAINAVSGELTEVGAVSVGTQPGVAVHPSGRTAYLISPSSPWVLQFAIDSATGLMTPMLPARVIAGTQPVAIAVDPTGRFAYAVNRSANKVSAYTIDPTTGALTLVSSGAVTGGQPNAVIVDPLGRFVYVANRQSGDVSAFVIDQTTGLLSQAPVPTVSASGSPSDIAVDGTGKYAYATTSDTNMVTTFSISSDGSLIPVEVKSLAPRNALARIALETKGRYAYVAAQTSGDVELLDIAQASGKLTSAAVFSLGITASTVALAPQGKFAYVTSYDDATVRAFTVDAATGALSSATTTATPNGPRMLAFAR